MGSLSFSNFMSFKLDFYGIQVYNEVSSLGTIQPEGEKALSITAGFLCVNAGIGGYWNSQIMNRWAEHII